MDLIHLKYKKCPQCGSRIISERQSNQHVNGHWNETQEFECGAIKRYSPNFKSEHGNTPCPHTDEKRIKIENRKNSITKLRKYINRLKVDEQFKKTLIKRTRYLI